MERKKALKKLYAQLVLPAVTGKRLEEIQEKILILREGKDD